MTPATLGGLLDRLPSGSAVYVDRDWMGGEGLMDVFSAIFAHGEEVRAPRGAVHLAGASDRDRVVWAMIETLAESVAEIAAQRGPARVLGSGLLASRVRERIPTKASATQAADVVIETTGSAAGMTQACSVAADLGTVLLAVTPLEGTMPYDLYSDVHRRGLNLVGVPDPENDRAFGKVSTHAFSPPTEIAPGAPRPPTSQWFVART